jgi:hypothetical protein
MKIKIFLRCAFSLTALATTSIQAQEATQASGPSAPSVVFRFPESFDTTGLGILFQTVGGFDRQVSSIAGKPNTHEYSTMYLGNTASSLKGYAYRKGYGVEIFTVDLSTGVPSRTITIAPKALGNVRLAGHASLPKGSPAGLNLSAEYTACWYCEFFGIFDCLLGSDRVGSAPIPVDGAFAFDVPDFARDPALTKFMRKGHFHFRVVDTRMNTVFWCGPDFIPVAESYPADLQLNCDVREASDWNK